MADTVETFPPEIQIQVKSKVFKIIEEAEIKCLKPKVNPPPQPASSYYGFSHSGYQDGNSSHFTNYPQASQTPYPHGSQTPYPQGPQTPTQPNSQNYSNDTTDLNFGI